MNAVNFGPTFALSQAPKRAEAAPAKSETANPSGDKVDFSRLPHADFDTNFAKISSRFRSNESVKVPDSFNEEPKNKDLDQSGIEKALVTELGTDLVRMQYHQDVSDLNGMIPTKAQLESEFTKLASDQSIPFEYIYDGCYGRAHLMCDQMSKDNINNAKMFVMVEDPSNKANRLEASNKYMEAKWWYHVAPVVFALDEQSHKVEPFIMDPSMSKHPMKPQEWIHAMWDEHDPIKIDITRNPQFGPAETDEINATFEESIQPSKEILAEYSKELAQIKEDYAHNHPGQTKLQKAA